MVLIIVNECMHFKISEHYVYYIMELYPLFVTEAAAEGYYNRVYPSVAPSKGRKLL